MPSGANKKSPSGGGGGKGSKHQQNNNNSKKGNDKTAAPETASAGDEDINSGFGQYMRSPQAIEMMKLFVVANTLVMFFTMAWPQMKHSYEILRSMIYGDEEDEL
ncbi:AAEL012089-PA [Aedes aegypti]|uniref:AAEL012089-PA n=1 Tax=Aedes aegypti TaxID=7159 RepID=Q16N48_AEDAE|nr:AAEL012089-PA [Aedes aegypti]